MKTKKTSEQILAEDLRKRAKGLRDQANLLFATAGKALRAGESEQAQKLSENANILLASADEMLATADAIWPITIEVVEEVADEVTETPEEEVEVPVMVAEAPEEEAEVAEEVTEEVADEVTETPEEEVEAPVMVAEAPEEEAEVAEEVTEEVTDEVTETPEEEVEAPVMVAEAPEEEAEVAEEVTDEATNGGGNDDNKKLFIIALIASGVIIAGLIIALIIALATSGNNESPVVDPGTTTAPIGVVDTSTIPGTTEPTVPGTTEPTVPSTTPGTTPGTTDPDTPIVEPEQFDMTEFLNSTSNIAKELTDEEDIAANVAILGEKIGSEKLKELVGKYGELAVQTAIAEYLAFVPEIKMNQYISKNGLSYNPNATDDYYQNLEDADKAYFEATGKNANGALMSLDGYDIHKSNREAMKALIAETGDAALLTWYEAKITGYDEMVKANADTDVAEAYKEEVKLELVTNANGSLKLLELQLEKEAKGELTVMDLVSMQYTADYNTFVLANYMYVVAN